LESEKLGAFGERLTLPSRTPPRVSAMRSTRQKFVGKILPAAAGRPHLHSDIKTAVPGIDPRLRNLHAGCCHRCPTDAGAPPAPVWCDPGEPIEPAKGIYKAQLIIENRRLDAAREKLVTPGQPAGNYLAHFGIHVFSPRIFESLEYLFKNNVREKNEFQLTAAQEHLRQNTDNIGRLSARGSV